MTDADTTPTTTPQRTLVERYTCEDAFRTAYVALAAACVGLDASPAGRADYLDLVGPDEPDNIKAAMTTQLDKHQQPGQSGCALVIRGLWRRAGIRHARLEAPYRNAKAVEDLYVIALECHAYRASHLPPLLGDVAHMTGPEHVATCADIIEADEAPGLRRRALVVTSYDGGQRLEAARPQERWETIRERVRRWQPDLRGWGIIEPRAAAAGDVGSTAAAGGVVTRRILGTIDVWKVYQRLAVGA